MIFHPHLNPPPSRGEEVLGFWIDIICLLEHIYQTKPKVLRIGRFGYLAKSNTDIRSTLKVLSRDDEETHKGGDKVF